MSALSTVVVVTWRGRDHITACLDALAVQKSPHRTIVVDNASDDGTAALISGHEVVRLPRNRGYAGGLAAVLDMVDTPYVAWLNDDAVPDPSWLTELENALEAEPDAAAATSSILLTDGSTQSVGVALTADGHGKDVVLAGREVFGFCGGAALLRTDALRAVGGVPASFFCYYEDTDTAWRLRLAGHRVISVGPARVRHRHGASTRPGSKLFHRWNERNRLLMLLRCAPAAVATTQLARFLVITALLPFRGNVPDAANFRLGLRAQVLGEVLLRLPATLWQRLTIRTEVPRRRVWQDWAGR
ncbi:glycosyltransferase family 2 protein [Lentzea aerocolonigenes]|uniref:glycosyltransferase family 2 protein n=1 Tax=Lentzea aerocolonigenes TaxID=68170 RepID=UPI000AA2E305|nr:glycosyltransferase family 2 protein [Lentzea aerocolonigenes]MCP2250020.1 Glycosyltransferase, GT2 family [Lentzea aerocolonigenes]